MPSNIQVVLLCGGKGTRLEGMDFPKPLCTIRGRPLIYHVLEALPKEIEIVTIFYGEGLKQLEFERTVTHLCHGLKKFRFKPICIETRGPVETGYVGVHTSSFDEDKPILFVDNDTVNSFSLSSIDPTRLGVGTFQTQDRTKPYSFLNVNEGRVLNIKEKEGISNTYSTGLYYFPSVRVFKNLCDDLFRGQSTRTEYFLSDLYAGALEKGMEVRAFPCDATVGLGTHADILENIHKVKHHPMRVCFDIDNTILTYSETVGTTDDIKPIPGMVEMLRKLHKDGHTIVLHTARGMKSCNSNLGRAGKKGMMSVFGALEEFEIPYDEIYFGKPWADIYVDDKAWNPYSNPGFSAALFNHKPDNSVLHLPKNCSNNENVLWRRGANLIKEGPTSSLEGEIYFYKRIQGTLLQGVCPRFVSDSVTVDRSYLVIEFLNGVSVSRLFRNGLLTRGILETVVHALEMLHNTTVEGDGAVTKEDILANYLGKLNERAQSHPNYKLEGLEAMLEVINQRVTEYVRSPTFQVTDVIHGDPWFDNMIYRYEDQAVKLLDMKGKVGTTFSMKGDRMVDYAKLYQSILGFDYYLNGEVYGAAYEKRCREWLEELLPFPITDPTFEAVTACCILKTFSYFSKTEPILPIYQSLGKMKLFAGLF